MPTFTWSKPLIFGGLRPSEVHHTTHPTEPFTILEPQNQWVEKLYLVQKRRKGRSGTDYQLKLKKIKNILFSSFPQEIEDAQESPSEINPYKPASGPAFVVKDELGYSTPIHGTPVNFEPLQLPAQDRSSDTPLEQRDLQSSVIAGINAYKPDVRAGKSLERDFLSQ